MAGAAMLIFFLTLSFSKAIFIEEPNNVTVEEGGVAKFRCAFKQDNKCEDMSWVFSKSFCNISAFQTIGACRSPSLNPTEDTTRFSLSFSDNVSQFQINNLLFSDVGMYACLYRSPADILQSSRCANLKIVEPPTPLCSVSPMSGAVGDRVMLTCKVPVESEIATKLTWHTDSTRTMADINPGLTLSEYRVLGETDNFRQFMCIAGNDVNEGPNCTVSPLQIDIQVTVRFPEEVIAEGDPLTFECDAYAVPDATGFNWSIKAGFANDTYQAWTRISNLAPSGKYEVAETKLTIYNVTESDDGQQVRCTAHNEIGLSKTSEAVTVVQCPDGRFVSGSIERCTQSRHKWVTVISGTLSAIVVTILVLVVILLKRRVCKTNKLVTANSLPSPRPSSIVIPVGLDRNVDENNDQKMTDNTTISQDLKEVLSSETSEAHHATEPHETVTKVQVGDAVTPTESQEPEDQLTEPKCLFNIGNHSSPLNRSPNDPPQKDPCNSVRPDPIRVNLDTSNMGIGSPSIKPSAESSTSYRQPKPPVPTKKLIHKGKSTRGPPTTPIGRTIDPSKSITVPGYMTVGEGHLGGSCVLPVPCNLAKIKMREELDPYEVISYQTL